MGSIVRRFSHLAPKTTGDSCWDHGNRSFYPGYCSHVELYSVQVRSRSFSNAGTYEEQAQCCRGRVKDTITRTSIPFPILRIVPVYQSKTTKSWTPELVFRSVSAEIPLCSWEGWAIRIALFHVNSQLPAKECEIHRSIGYEPRNTGSFRRCRRSR